MKTEDCHQKFWNAFDQFGIIISCSATNFLEVVARVLLKVAFKGSLKGKKFWKFSFLECLFRISKEKKEEGNQKNWSFF